MKGSILLVALAIGLIVGGFVMVQILASGPDGILPVRVQTLNPEGSTLETTTNQALIFLGFVVFAVGSLVGISAVLGLILKFVDGQITSVKDGAPPRKGRAKKSKA